MNVAGLGARVLASLIDLAVIALLDWPVWRVLGGRTDGLAQLALQALPAAYFIAACTRVGGGQTVGKRLCALRVMSVTGGPLQLGQSVRRWAIAVASAFPLWWLRPSPPEYAMPSFVTGALVLGAVVGLLVADSALLLLNRPTRQSLHDLGARSVVVRASLVAAPSVPAPTRRVALLVVSLVASAGVLAFPAYRLSQAIAPRAAELVDAAARMRAAGAVRRLIAVPTFHATGADSVWRVTAYARLASARSADTDAPLHAVACAIALHAPRAMRGSELALVGVFRGAALSPVALLFDSTDVTPSACAAKDDDGASAERAQP